MARCPLLPFSISSPNFGHDREEWVGRRVVLLWNVVDYAVMAFGQPFSLVPARPEFHVHENLSSLFSHPTNFSYLLRPSGDINTVITIICNFFKIDSGCVVFGGLLPDQNVVFDQRSGRSFLSVRVFACTLMLSVLGAGSNVCALPLLRPVSSILLSFAGDTSPSMFSCFYYTIFSKVLQKTLALPQS